MGFVKLLVVLFTLAILEKVGRRPMLLASTVLVGLACVWTAVAFAASASTWVLALGFVFFMAGFSLGLGPITFVYASEVFPTRWRAKGMAVTISSSRIVGSTIALLFPSLVEGIGVSMSFWLLTAFNVVFVILIWA